jgi:hypothetical protein
LVIQANKARLHLAILVPTFSEDTLIRVTRRTAIPRGWPLRTFDSSGMPKRSW